MPHSEPTQHAGWEYAFQPFIQLVKNRFGFLHIRGYDAPKITVRQRECSIVYFGSNLTNIAVFHDLDGPPYVEVVPLTHIRSDGSTRIFGLVEAVKIIHPMHEKPAFPTSDTGFHSKSITEWIDWYAASLETHFTHLIPPTDELLEAIECNRRH